LVTLGTVLQNRYQVIALLGQGGMGAVYQARDLRLGNRLIVVKENRGGDPRQFQLEANVLAQLNHPNLPRVSDHFMDAAGAQYLVMDYVEGQNLDEVVQQRGAISENLALMWMRQIFDAVKYLHANRIVHRDIKPQNIIITPQNRAVLVDFGIAKIMATGQTTFTGARAGSPGFAPPEQYTGGTTERSDIYALGGTLYFLLTGVVPPEAPNRAAGIALIAPRQINPAISPNAERMILTALNLSAAQRFPSVVAMEKTFYDAPMAIPTWINPMTLIAAGLVAVGILAFLVILVGFLYISALNLDPASQASSISPTPISTSTRLPPTPGIVSEIPTLVPTASRTPTPTRTPTRAQTPTPAAPRPVVVFREDFDGSRLDSSRWSAANTGNPITVNSGILRLASSSTNYPFIYSRYNPFPASGDYRMSYRFRYTSVNWCGVGILMTSYALSPGLGQDQASSYQKRSEENGVAVGVWQDLKEGLHVLFRSREDRVDVPYPGPDTAWHEMIVEYSQGQYKIHLDRTLSYTSKPTPHRAQFIWLGNPVELGAGFACPWDTLELDYIQVESLP